MTSEPFRAEVLKSLSQLLFFHRSIVVSGLGKLGNNNGGNEY